MVEGRLPSLDLGLAMAASLPLADVISSMLRTLHQLIDHFGSLPDGPLKEAVASHIASLRTRGRRLEELPGGRAALPAGFGGLESDDEIRAYVQPDLDAVLDGTARLLGPALMAGRQGDRAAASLLQSLGTLLYDDLGKVPLARGWFSLDTVVPGQSRFDPGRHRALSSERVEGLKGYVVAVQRVGRRRADTGALLSPAEVVVAA